MLKITNYVTPQSVEEAYEYLQKNRNNKVIGGMLWLKMMDMQIHTAIDLSVCHLDQIEETNDEIKIGAMTTLRQIETESCFQDYYGGVLVKAVKDIVGVQFRNLATIGGSVYSRFGFSDVLCALMALPCDVILHHHGRISIEEYSKMAYERDIITHIVLKKNTGQGCYLTIRNSATDIPALALCVSRDDKWNISVGARPKKAVLYTVEKDADIHAVCQNLCEEIELEDNGRASAAYRKQVLAVLLMRAVKEIEQC